MRSGKIKNMPERDIKIEDIIIEITEYESLAKVKLEEARFQAEEEINKAEHEGQNLLQKKREEAQREAEKIISEAKKNASTIANKITQGEKERVETCKKILPEIQQKIKDEIMETILMGTAQVKEE